MVYKMHSNDGSQLRLRRIHGVDYSLVFLVNNLSLKFQSGSQLTTIHAEVILQNGVFMHLLRVGRRLFVRLGQTLVDYLLDHLASDGLFHCRSC